MSATKPLRHLAAAGEAFRKLWIWTSADESDIAASPTITSGTGAPSASLPKGSIYLRSSGTGAGQVVYVATDSAGTWTALTGTQGARTDLIFDAATELTIASGAITATQGAHTVDTQSDAASDDLDTMAGGTAEEVVWLRPVNTARSVVVKHAIGANCFACPGGRDITLAETTDMVAVYYNGTQWIVVAWSTLALGGGGLGSALASVANGLGASLVGVEDAGLYYTAANVEAVLAELGATREYEATVTITAAQLRTLNATPITVIAAPGAGKYIDVICCHWFLDYGGVQMDAAAAGDTLVLKYTNGSGTAITDAVAGDTIGGATADYHTSVIRVPELIPVTNALVCAHINTGEWYAAAGTSELKALVRYRIITQPT